MKDFSQLKIEQLKTENELKTKWLSLISHDFKGLFQNIIFLLDAFENNNIPQDKFLSMLPEIKQIAKKNLKTIESTFSWVNSQMKVFELQVTDVHIYELFLELQENLKTEIKQKRVRFKFSGDETLFLNTDKFLLSFILKQTLENAIKYSNIDGDVLFIAYKKEDHIYIEIQDSGMGMSNSILNNLFTLNGTPYKGTMGEKGSGLSLVIVKEFAEKLNSQIEVSSEEGKGTIIRLLFSV